MSKTTMEEFEILQDAADDAYVAWVTKYKPIKNPILVGLDDLPWDGQVFETYGEDDKFVRRQLPSKIWTVVEDDGNLFLQAGYRFVDRQFYFVTEVPWENESISFCVVHDIPQEDVDNE